MRAAVWDFMVKLELPPKFMTHKCLAMMILMLFPTIRKKESGRRLFCEELEVFLKEIRIPCYEVFKENNIKKRSLFFREPLIKWLWNKFTDMCPDITINHLRRTRSHPLDGEYRYQRLVKDMLEMEQTFDVKIIPQEAREKDILNQFTPEEAEKDLQQTYKFNKRSA